MTREEAIRRIKAWNLDSDDREVLAVVIPELAESEDERIRKEIIDFIQWSVDRHFMREDFHQAKRPAVWIAYLERQKRSLGIIEYYCKGVKGPSCDPGRRGRLGGVPKEISKEAEAFQAQFPAPYDKDDIITAYETAKIKAMEDLPKWKEAKNCGKGECYVGAAFEATGRRYPILFCYGYGISIEQLFEKLPKEDK